MARILLVEDDPSILENLSILLGNNGFSVQRAGSVRAAEEAMRAGRFDLLLVDLTLPDGSGFSVCSAARGIDPGQPVIFLTATDDEGSVVAGLSMGADDYVSKPFRPMELVSRIRTVLRRRSQMGGVLRLGDVEIDPGRARVTRAGRELFLSALEYRLLMLLVANRDSVLTREQLLSALWDVGGEFVNDNTLTVYIKRLREKIGDDPQNPAMIRTVRGLGYKAGE